MQNSKTELLNKISNLLNLAASSSPDLPNEICRFLVDEYELQAVALFKFNEQNKLTLKGKSNDAKKSYSLNSVYECKSCNLLKEQNKKISLNIQSDCEIQVSEYVIYESCLFIKSSGKNDSLLKLAKKTPFTPSDKENIEAVANALSSIMNLWFENEKSATVSTAELISEIAQELRTPTNSIMGFASLLYENKLTPTQTEYVSTLKESAFNLLALINDLIDLAKVDTGTCKLALSNTNIKSFVDEVIKIFNEKINKNIIDFIVNIEKTLPETMRLDVQKLRFIFSTIITYALRLTEKGKISISVYAGSQNQVNFKISDTSPGISANKLKDVFKPFSLIELGNPKIGNTTGLSLLLAKKYIELLKGEIEVTSSLGKGTTYSFNIKSENISTIEAQISALPKPGKKNKVLVVEDDYATSKLLSNYLNKWGYEPTIVNSAEQALKIIDKEIFLAILMDIVLPDANGFELLKRIREHKNAKNTPVIVCSVEAEQQKAFLMGAVEYFVKPIQYKFLVEVLTSYRLKKDSNILIVDDDVPTLSLIKEAIEQAGYNAIAESHSSRVMNMIEAISLDLAIIDLDMPEINGFDLIKKIKSNPKFSNLPIIIYTGKENYEEDIKKIDGMFADLLRKSSTNIEQLSDAINQMINRFDEPPSAEEIAINKDPIKILLVEDYKHSQIIVTRLLKKNNFESIVVVENGAEAVEAVQKQKFNLILMDMQMPVMNGFEATEKIRQMKDYKEIPIIALTAFAMKGDREKCLEAGATDYIPKPIDSQEFIEKVKYYTNDKVIAV
ncbi:MAG: response regulator [Ignavibacteriaceae bacterium]